MNETYHQKLKLELIGKILLLSDLNDLKQIKATIEGTPENYLDNRLLNTNEAVAYMGISKPTLFRCHGRDLKSLLVCGRRMYRRTMLDEFIADSQPDMNQTDGLQAEAECERP